MRSLIRSAWAQDTSAAAILADARSSIQSLAQPVSQWDGPAAGPKAQKAKRIIYISSDQRNGGALGVIQAIFQSMLLELVKNTSLPRKVAQ